MASEAPKTGVGTLPLDGPNSSFQEPTTAKDPTPRLPLCLPLGMMMRWGPWGLASEALEGGVGTLSPEGPNSNFQDPTSTKDPIPRLPLCVIKMRMMHFGANDTQGASLSTDF